MLRNNLTIVSLLVALACMSGCAGFTRTNTVVQTITLTPADSLLQPCAHAPRPAGTKVADLAQALINERAQLEGCDWGDKAALRAWKAGVSVPAK
jgi:hypothetical protein